MEPIRCPIKLDAKLRNPTLASSPRPDLPSPADDLNINEINEIKEKP